MPETINHDGLVRLVNLELSRLRETNPAEAARIIKGRVGPYDIGGITINKTIENYFSTKQTTALAN
jgi:hypothetical protein